MDSDYELFPAVVKTTQTLSPQAVVRARGSSVDVDDAFVSMRIAQYPRGFFGRAVLASLLQTHLVTGLERKTSWRE
jgi:hypothetical protein